MGAWSTYNKDMKIYQVCMNLLFGWLVILRIYVVSVVCQPYRHLEAGDNQSLKSSSGEAGNGTPVLLHRKPRSRA